MVTIVQHPTRAIDVSGLPEETIRAVEVLVSHLRGQSKAPEGGTPLLSSYEEWSREFRNWLASHKPTPTAADWSRESIYDDQGE